MILLRGAVIKIFVILALIQPINCASFQTEEIISVTITQLLKDPGAYNKKLIKVTGLISYGFENFSISELNCVDDCSIWLEYGGEDTSETTYCCGISAKRKRPSTLKVANIEIPLRKDKNYKRFNSLIQRKRPKQFKATLIGRFFAEKIEINNRTIWGGYGHMGIYKLLAIQQVQSIDLLRCLESMN